MPVRIEVDVVGQLVPQIEAAMKADGQRPYFSAAMFYYENDLDLDKAAEWMTAALEKSLRGLGISFLTALSPIIGMIVAGRRSRRGRPRKRS